MTERIDRYVEAVLRRKRPPRFQADADELEALAGVHALLLAQPGRDLPDAAFLDRLHGRLRSELDSEPASRTDAHVSRRVLLGSGAAAAAALIGGAAGFGLRGLTAPAAAALVPEGAGWIDAVSLQDLEPGSVLVFSTPAMRVLLVNDGGTVRALSGACTHLGCSLQPADAAIACPCHRTRFRLDGRVERHQLPEAPSALPQLRVRVAGGRVEVYGV